MALLRKVVALALITAIVLGLYPLMVTKATHPAQLSAYDDDPDDLSELKGKLEAQGYQTASLFSSPLLLNQLEEGGPNNTILFIIGVEQGYSEFEAKAINEFLGQGGSVVLADDFGYGNSAIKGFQSVGVSFFNDPLYDLRGWKRGDNASIVHLQAQPTTWSGSYELYWSQATALQRTKSISSIHAYSSPNSFVDLDHDGKGGPEEVANQSVGGIPVIAEVEVGDNGGKMVIIGDPSMFINDLLEVDDNWEFTRDMVAYLAKGSTSQTTIIFEESRHLQTNILDSVYVQLFGWLAYGAGNMVARIIILAVLILGLEFVLMRVANPTLYRHTFNPAVGRTSRWRVPHTYYLDPETVRKTLLEKVRIINGLSHDDFQALQPTELEQMVKDPLLVGFLLNKDDRMALGELLQAMDRWSK